MSLYRFPVNCHISRLPHTRPHISTPLYSLLSSGLGDDIPVLVKSVSKIRFHGFEGNFFKRKKKCIPPFPGLVKQFEYMPGCII